MANRDKKNIERFKIKPHSEVYKGKDQKRNKKNHRKQKDRWGDDKNWT